MYKILIVVNDKLQHELIYHQTDITQQNINLSIWEGSENSVTINKDVLQQIHDLKIEDTHNKANYFGGEHFIANHRRQGAAIMSHTFIEYEYNNMYLSRKYLFFVKDITWNSQEQTTSITFTSFLTGGSQGDNNTSNLLNFPLPISKQNLYLPSAQNRNASGLSKDSNTLFGGGQSNVWTSLNDAAKREENPIVVLWQNIRAHILGLPFKFDIKLHNTLYGNKSKIQELYRVKKSMALTLTNLKKYIHPGANFSKTILYLCRKFQYYYWFEWDYNTNELVMFISDIGFTNATLTEETPGVEVISHKFFPNKIKHYALTWQGKDGKRVASDMVMRYDEYELSRHLQFNAWNRMTGYNIKPTDGEYNQPNNYDRSIDFMPPNMPDIGSENPNFKQYWPKEFYFVNGDDWKGYNIENLGDKKDITGFYGYARNIRKYILYFNKIPSNEQNDTKSYVKLNLDGSRKNVDYNDVKHMWTRPLALKNVNELKTKGESSFKDWQLWRESKYHPYSMRFLDKGPTTQEPLYHYEKKFMSYNTSSHGAPSTIVNRGEAVEISEANSGWESDKSSYGVKDTNNWNNTVRTVSSQFTLLKTGEEQVLNNWDTTMNEIELTYDLSKNDVNGFQHLMPGVYIHVQYKGNVYTQLVTEIEISDAKILRIIIGDKSRGMYAITWPEEFSL